ncbi:Rhodanese-like domain-containing protein [Phycomyces blakesleeanus]
MVRSQILSQVRFLPRQWSNRAFSATSSSLDRWSDVVSRTQKTLQVTEIAVSDLENELSGDSPSSSLDSPVVIDVREATEWKLGKIPHAICLSRGVLELKIEKVVPVDSQRPIVLYCAGGYRSIMAAEALVRMGYNKDLLRSLKGGFGAWCKKGYAVEGN